MPPRFLLATTFQDGNHAQRPVHHLEIDATVDAGLLVSSEPRHLAAINPNESAAADPTSPTYATILLQYAAYFDRPLGNATSAPAATPFWRPFS